MYTLEERQPQCEKGVIELKGLLYYKLFEENFVR